jgi:hypothetical protein
MSIIDLKIARGPNKFFEGSNFDFKDLRFPQGVGNNPRLLHSIKFTPTIQTKSSYNVKTTGPSAADVNREGGAQLGSSTDPFGAGDALGIGLGLGAIAGIAAFGEAIDAVADADPVKVVKAPVKIAGAIAAGGLRGIAAGAIISAIDLTRKTRRAASSITLYMPDTVTQTQVANYDAVSMTEAFGDAGLIAQAGGSVIDSAKAAAQSGSISFGQTPGSGAIAEVGAKVAGATGAFGGNIEKALLFSAGVAKNPQVELLFENIANREFLFDFKFVPRNPQEAKEIIKIIQTFRFFAAPEIPKLGKGRYFIPPSEFDIEFMVGSKINPNLPLISTCVLEGIDVNYGSAGQWTAFTDGMPVEISMQLRFKEVEILHKELIQQGY